MAHALINKLRRYTPLPTEDAALLGAQCQTARDFPARHDLVREGDEPGPIFVILSGWACRSKILPDGSRRILSLLVPGDSCEVFAALPRTMDHTLTTLTPARVAIVQRQRFEALVQSRPALVQSFRFHQLACQGTLRAWIINTARRSSIERVANLIMELWTRAEAVGLTSGTVLQFPLTQIVLGEALGLTPVHVNRVLRTLRQSGLLTLAAGRLEIRNLAALAKLAEFDDGYLQLVQARPALDELLRRLVEPARLSGYAERIQQQGAGLRRLHACCG